jgi:hypothetical protein
MLKKILFGISLLVISHSKMSMKLKNTVQMNTVYDLNKIMGMYYVSPVSSTQVIGGGKNSNVETNVSNNAVVNSVNMINSDNSKIGINNNLISNVKK